MAWALFNASPQLPSSIRMVINGSTLHFAPSRGNATGVTLMNVPAQPVTDLVLVGELIAALDAHEGIKDNPLLADDAGSVQLSQGILYLRITHSYDYFGGRHLLAEHDMPGRLEHITVPKPALPPPPADQPQPTGQPSPRWQNDAKDMVKGPLDENEVAQLGGESPEAAEARFITSKIEVVNDKLYRCVLCSKAFMNDEFVRKHLHNKHPDALTAAREEAEYFRNYLRDRQRPLFHVGRPPVAAGTFGKSDLPRMFLLRRETACLVPSPFATLCFCTVGRGRGPR